MSRLLVVLKVMRCPYFAGFLTSALLASSALADRTVTITTLKGQMKYDKASFSVKPGEKVTLILKNEDDMHHNLVITKSKDKGMAVAMKAWELGTDGFAKHWIPEHPDILFSGKMADPQKEATLQFTAPKKVGDYPYVCTLPGHAQIMNGVMKVTKKANSNPLSELTFVAYKGKWEQLPDFNQLKPTGTDHVKGGKFDLAVTKERDEFGIVFDARFAAAEEGTYEFEVGSDDGSRLTIDGKVVVDNDKIHGMQTKSGKVKLSPGQHDLKLEYFEARGGEELYVGYKGPGMKKFTMLSKGRKRGGGGAPPTGMPLVAENEARIYRNFIEGAGSRGIGVGYPGGLNLAYDANNMRIALLWRGEYIDAARHWNGRGQGFQPPLAEKVSKGTPGVPFAVLPDSKMPWPDTYLRKDNAEQPKLDGGYVFKGYTLYGDERIPLFNFTFQGRHFEQTPIPSKNNKTNRTTFLNTFAITGPPIPDLHYRAAVADTIEANPDGSFSVGSDLVMSFSDTQNSLKPFLRKSAGKTELLVPISVGVFRQTIRWQ